MRRPTVDLARCRDCDACLEVCPGVFGRNEDTGRLEVAEAMSLCPENCICWEEGPP
ncbi:MAG: ferredoxin [Deltaproteobacteria bacterium]|nr:ferredoxin [Deltaproteobacteria bacterium]MBW1922360.1 ferredoxin [Deltaproteobacteria bacterium]MBW1948112.1 ferredoxin [Deltaproteobacteria bacterium]MBW2006537.1 ferredoxin [Deltaproteobacteria bacterium]MBW2346415.1 ferredoxin [Deltaproteobacteria bacterium]